MSQVVATRTADIHISAPQLGPEVEALVLQVLRSGHLAQGLMVERFEALCAGMAGVTHAVALSNGTVALQAALEACGVGPGDEVITTPFTFAATVNAILRTGATVRFADICADYTVDADAVRHLVNPRTRAIIPVHLYGLMADMDALAPLAKDGDVALIEDAAQAHGASQHGRRAGSYGTGTFSFYATKNVTSGEGGCLTTSDPAVADRVRLMRNQGMRARYEYVLAGENWRLTDVAAAIAIPQLERLDAINAARRRNAEMLTEMLRDDDRVSTPSVPHGRQHVWHQYTVLIDPHLDRERVVRAMAAAGVHAGVYYPRLVWDYDAYRARDDVQPGHTPLAAMVAARCLSLPVHPGLGTSDLERVAATLRDALNA